MSEKAASWPAARNSQHTAAVPRADAPQAKDLPAAARTSRPQPVRMPSRPSHIPLGGRARQSASPSLAGGRARLEARRLRPSAASPGITLPIADPAGHYEQRARQLEAAISGTRPRLGRGPRPPAVAPAIVHEALRTGDRPLQEPVRRRFAAELHDDIRDVRVHTGELASASAKAVGALAYTAGRHVVLGARLTEATGYTVLAHELAHIAQREPGLHRYESGEHARAGSTARKVTINSVTMNEGDLAALADLYETPDDIYKAPSAELKALEGYSREASIR